jgi:hypothetical protein
MRNPLDKATPVTRGVKPAVLLGVVATTPRQVGTVAKHTSPPPPPPADPTVEIIRGDKRAHEVVRQESQ